MAEKQPSDVRQVDYIDFTQPRRNSERDIPGCDSSLSEYAATIASNVDLADRLPKTQFLCCRVSFLNVLLMGFAFMFNIGAYTTAGMIQTIVLNANSTQDQYFNGSSTLGYTLWAISSGTQALAYFFGPSLVALIAPKAAMVLGSVFVSLYIACFIRPLLPTLLIGSALMGFGVGIIWEVQGYFITINSTPKRVLRNTGVFWGLYQSSLVTGNLFYFLMLRGQSSMSSETREIIFVTLLAVSIIGTVAMGLIVHPWLSRIPRPKSSEGSITDSVSSTNSESFPSSPRSPKEALVEMLRCGRRKDMIYLIPIFVYIGIEGSFWVNVYGTALSYTEALSTDPSGQQSSSFGQGIVGLSGISIGVGEILGSIFLGLLGKWMHFNGKETVLIFGLIVHVAAYYLSFLYIPARATIEQTLDISYMQPNEYVVLAIAFMLGIGDAIWNSQLMGYLGCAYRDDCVTAYAVYQTWCAIGGAAAFVWAGYLTLPYQLLILVVFSVPAAAGFCVVEWEFLKSLPKYSVL